jgi:F0F1-type ATP synthase assembly protein I
MVTGPPSETPKEERFWASVLIGAAVGLSLGFAGFALAAYPASRPMGEVLFVLVPFAAGAAIAMITPQPVAAATLLSAVTSLLICLIALVGARLEGILCAMMAFPIIFVSLLAGILIGAGLGYLIRFARGDQHIFTINSLILFAMPAMIFAGHRLEIKNLVQSRQQSVTTTVHLAATPEQVWANIQSLDHVAGRKPILMYVGLPIPQRCVLQGTALGSKRICYFDQGSIEESILEWQPPYHMRLAIDRTNMPGRHWLGFESAEYNLKADATGTTLARVTTITSKLHPAWYWEGLEAWGVSDEHDFLFSDLARRFSPQN